MQARIRAKRAFKSDGQAVRARLIRFRGGKALRVLGFKGQQGRGHAKGIEPVADARKANRHRVRGSLNHGFRLRRHPVHIAPVAFGQRGAGAPFPHHKIAL